MLALLQFDSPSTALLDSMLGAGRLPVLGALRARGTLGSLDTSPSLYEAAIYPTLYTGVDVGDHALYSAFLWAPEAQCLQDWQRAPKPPTAWERLAAAGRRSLVVDPYQGWAAPRSAGLWVSGCQFRNRMVLPRWSAPSGALSALEREIGTPPDAETTFGRPDARGLLRMRNALVEAPGRAATVVERRLAREPFDLLWVTLSGVHLAGHYLWDRSVLPEGELDADARRTLDAALTDVYAAADAALGRILAALPAGSDVVVFSPDGMGPNTSRSDLLPAMLAAVLGDPREAVATTGGALWRLRARIPARVRAAAARVLPDDVARHTTAALHTWGTDWRRTRAFALPGDCYGFVRANLRGRERDGVVPPDDLPALLEEVAAGLMTFRDPDGTPSVAAVEPVPAAIAKGRLAHRLPDLVVRWSDGPTATLSGVRSSRFGEVARLGAGPGLSGNHADGAWILLVAAGGGGLPDGSVHLRDFAATACARAGVDATDLRGVSFLASPA